MNIEEFIQEKKAEFDEKFLQGIPILVSKAFNASALEGQYAHRLTAFLETALREAVEKAKILGFYEGEVKGFKDGHEATIPEIKEREQFAFERGVRAVVLEKTTGEEMPGRSYERARGFNQAVDELEAVKAKLLGGTDGIL